MFILYFLCSQYLLCKILLPVFACFFQNSDCDPSTTVHVDAFLYDEDTVDDLCDEGHMSRNYCQPCGSHDVKPLSNFLF